MNVQVGQEVAVVGRYGTFFVTVKKVTPSGQVVTVRTMGTETYEQRFDKDGRERSGHATKYSRDYLRLDVEQVRAEKALEVRSIAAAKALNEIGGLNVRHTYAKESMMTILVDLEAKVAIARAAVEAI